MQLGRNISLWEASDWWWIWVQDNPQNKARTSRSACNEEIPERNLTANVFWDIDAFHVDFLPSGTRQSADSDHSFLSRECVREHAVKKLASLLRKLVTLMVAKSTALCSAGGEKKKMWKTLLENSNIIRPRGKWTLFFLMCLREIYLVQIKLVELSNWQRACVNKSMSLWFTETICQCFNQ